MFRRLGLIAGLIITVSFLGYVLLDSQDYRLVFKKQYQLTVVSSPTFVCPLLTGPLAIGGKGLQVRYLQQILARYFSLPDGYFPSGRYDQLTIELVKRYQRENNIVSTGDPSTTGYGLAGVITRKHLRDWCVRTFGVSDLPIFGAVADQIRQIQLKLIALLRQLIAILLGGGEPLPSPPPPKPVCGRNGCETGENCSNCPHDCGTCPPACGDNEKKGSEVCDGSDLDDQNCQSQGFLSGTLFCRVNCSGFDTSQCVAGECTEGQTQPCSKVNEFGTCMGTETCINNQWMGCNARTPIEEACDKVDNDCDGQIDEDCQEYTLTYYSKMIDTGDLLNPQEWQTYVNTMLQLRDIGFTHAGIRIWSANTDPALINERVNELRNHGLKLAINHGPGSRYLTETNSQGMDPDSHPSSGQNLKYFDAPGFDPYYCDRTFKYGWCERHNNGPHCQNKPDWTANDPAYDGLIWQKELDVTRGIVEIIHPTTEDLVLFDLEVWGTNESYFEGCYPGAVQNSVGRYSGTLQERYAQYWNYWRQRGHDLKQIVKNNNNSLALFYNENIPSLINNYTSMPDGSGDAPSPHLYSLPFLNILQQKLAGGNFTGSYVWINLLARSGTWTDENWDPRITQKAGYLLREEGVAGVIVYPSPMHRGGPSVFLPHAQALVNGFVHGIDPGVLTEACGDNRDNDGDGEIDENC